MFNLVSDFRSAMTGWRDVERRAPVCANRAIRSRALPSCAALVAASLAFADPALAGGGAASDGGNGGADQATAAGGSGASYGGGGGAGTTGGAGADGFAVDANANSYHLGGGTGGAAAGQAGSPGQDVTGAFSGIAGGGGGGAHGFTDLNAPGTLPSVAVTGGAGGNGGSSSGVAGGNGGGGGAGGWGAVITGAGALGTLAVTVTGGKGGDGGSGLSGYSGGGGSGGVGLALTGVAPSLIVGATVTGGNGGSGRNLAVRGNDSTGANGGDGITASGATLTINGSVAGGNGGSGGVGGNGGNGIAAAGATLTINGSVAGGNGHLSGDGIVGAGLTVINSGTISSGSGQGDWAIWFTGGTNVLELRAGSTITSGVADLTGNGTFRLGGTTSGSFDVSALGAQYQGFSTFVKSGSSTWTLTGFNSRALPWSINAGTLDVNGGATHATMTVNAGGTLSGIGGVGAVIVNPNGTFAPGSGAPGTSMTVASLALTSGAIYLAQVNPATASFATVKGAATLSGATVNAVFASGSYISKQYTILSAGSVSGTFNPTVVNGNLPSGFRTTLSYDATHAYLNLALNFTPPSGSLSGNQQGVGNAIINYFNSNGSIAAVFGGLTPAGLAQLSGEVGSAPQQATFNAMSQFMGLVMDPFAAGRGDEVSAGGAPNAYAEESLAYAAGAHGRSGSERDAYAAMSAKAPVAPPFLQRWSVWAAGFGGSQATDGNAVAGSSNVTSSLYGTAVGADYRISRDTLVGFALAGGGSNFTVANALGGGRSDLFQAGAFFRHNAGPAYIAGALAYGWQDITTDRTVTVAGLDRLRAEFNANAWSGRLEGGYRFAGQGFGWTPYAAAQVTTFELPAYAEQAIVGSNQFALAYNAKSVSDPRTELGLRTDKSIGMDDGVVTLRGRLAWAHDYSANRSIGATFQTLPGASFVVNGAAQAADSALVTASVEKRWLNGWSAAATFEGEFSGVTASYAGKGVVRHTW